MYEAERRYHELLKMGVPLEDARYLLPAAAQTTIVMTANLREWRHILKMRLSRHAQAEIRHMSGLILDLLIEQVAPAVFADLREVYGE
jgi:thymidylate synthase (FAD)